MSKQFEQKLKEFYSKKSKEELVDFATEVTLMQLAYAVGLWRGYAEYFNIR